MPGEQHHRLTLELDDDAGSISGRLSDERTTREFSGWVGLAGALEGFLEGRSGGPKILGEERGKDEGTRPVSEPRAGA
jgi:hypothetical protein